MYTQYMRECICVESEREKSWVKLFWLICSGYWQQGWIGCFETLVVVPFLFSSLCYFTSLSYQTNKYLIHHYIFFHKTSMYIQHILQILNFPFAQSGYYPGRHTKLLLYPKIFEAKATTALMKEMLNFIIKKIIPLLSVLTPPW